LTEGAFVDGDKTKLDGIEAGADITDTANVTAAGALMDSEVTNLDDVKAFDPTDYATAAQGTTADNALKPASNLSDLSDALTARNNLNILSGFFLWNGSNPGSATAIINITGITTTSIISVTAVTSGNGTFIQSAVPGSGTLTLTMSGATDNGTKFSYIIIN